MSGLNQLIQQIEQLPGLIDKELTPVVAAALLAETQKGFRASEDPYGRQWKPLALRKGRPLRDTGRLQNSFAYRVVGPGTFEIGTNVMYATTHQYGAVIRPKNKPFLAFQVRG